MRFIRIQLKRSNTFWSLSGLTLTKANPISQPIDIDELLERNLDTIESAIRRGEINVFDMDENLLQSIKDVKDISDVYVSTEDVQEEVAPEVQSVTVSLDEEDEMSVVSQRSTEAIMADALIVVNNNGNTVKKTLAAIDISSPDGLSLLKACLSAEIGGKNRTGILDMIQERLG